MRSPARNRFPVYYRMYLGETEITDRYGNPTGSFSPQYGALKVAFLALSPNRGNSEAEMFGTLEDYDRTMTTTDTGCEIDEDTVLWLDGADTEKAHNFIVKKRAPWKNSISYAVKRVDAAHG